MADIHLGAGAAPLPNWIKWSKKLGRYVCKYRGKFPEWS